MHSSGPEFKIFSCSTQLSMKIFLLINVHKCSFMSRKNSIDLSEPGKKLNFLVFLY